MQCTHGGPLYIKEDCDRCLAFKRIHIIFLNSEMNSIAWYFYIINTLQKGCCKNKDLTEQWSRFSNSTKKRLYLTISDVTYQYKVRFEKQQKSEQTGEFDEEVNRLILCLKKFPSLIPYVEKKSLLSPLAATLGIVLTISITTSSLPGRVKR